MIPSNAFCLNPWVEREACALVEYGYRVTFIRMELQFQAGYISTPLATRRLHAAPKTADRSVKFCADRTATLDKVFARADLPEKIRSCKKFAYSNRHVSCASRCLQAEKYSAARHHLLDAIKLWPDPFSKRMLKNLAMLVQSVVGKRFIMPEKRRQRKFLTQHGHVPTNWFRSIEN